MKLFVSPKKIIVWLAALVIIFNGASFVGRYIESILGIEITKGFIRLFDSTIEGNLTSWFSAVLLLFSAYLLWIIARTTLAQNGPDIRYWRVLSGIFFYMSLDEAASIHELVMHQFEPIFNKSGIFHYSWVIVATPFVLVFVAVYLRFLFRLPIDTRWGFLIAGFIFIFGSLGIYMIEGYLFNMKVQQDHLYLVLSVIEEFLENVGIVIFIYALLIYIRTRLEHTEIRLEWV